MNIKYVNEYHKLCVIPEQTHFVQPVPI